MIHPPRHGHNHKRATTEWAEQTLDTIGYRLGFLAGKASQRFEQVVSSTAHTSPQPQAPDTGKEAHNGSPSLLPSEEATQQAFARAEEFMQRAEQRLGQWSARLSYQSQRLVARTREDLEDIWAEAQHLRCTKRRP